ncbi:(2Fe-2S) ferredoxin domain-containing protein [Streptomyces sp. NPDC058228]|uniref:(2Fe-2S) ferredoxin domain-containing protein n=1 Tax=Streptomyces sp. NPDC058228 TaxID=3346390 RepID=UPI0036EBCE14
MSRRTRKAATSAPGAPRPTVSVCRGCCCGTPKIPDVDHAGQLAVLRRSLGEIAAVRAVECLDACEQANVIVVQPSAEGRRAGGPGLADAPDILDLYTFRPSRRVQQELGSF